MMPFSVEMLSPVGPRKPGQSTPALRVPSSAGNAESPLELAGLSSATGLAAVELTGPSQPMEKTMKMTSTRRMAAS